MAKGIGRKNRSKAPHRGSERQRAVAWLRQAPTWQTCAVFLCAFVGLTAWNADTIAAPPAKEQALGIWMEANFLAETHFDYGRLTQQEGEDLGGPRLYIISALPTIIAGLMLATGNAKTAIVLYHLFTYACASVVAVVVVQSLRPSTGPLIAGLACVAMLTLPLFSAQTSLCGMELPLAAFSAVALYQAVQGHFARASVSATLAFLMKMSGGVVTVALLAYLLLQLIAGNSSNLSKSEVARGLLAAGIALAAQIMIFMVGVSFMGLGRN